MANRKKKASGKTKKSGRAETSPTPPSTKPSGFGLESEAIERALITGESPGLLEDYFGPENYRELRDLSRDAATRSVRGGPRVLILPGIMGSTLGRKTLLRENILWIDPAEIALGKLTDLKLSGSPSRYHAVGVVLLAYLKLKLRLKIAGFDADFFAYDWRRSLGELGVTLADAVRKEPSSVMLVAHSMGGLVARSALASAGQKVTRLIMLGTPNYGSFAPVQVLRGTYDVVQKIAALDLFHKTSDLCEVFNTFPGLYEMLPSTDKFSALDLYDTKAWPTRGPRPRPELLSSVKPVIKKLSGADARFFLIAGVNQDTVTGVRVENGDFSYEISQDGDGTVPLEFARLAGIPGNQIYYVEESHGSLPNNGSTESAVIDLLSSGKTSALPAERPPAKRAMRVVSEKALLQAAESSRIAGQPGTADYRHLLDAVAAPPRSREEGIGRLAPSVPSGGPGADPAVVDRKLQHLTIGRQRQRRLELTLVHGSITDVNVQAYVLGVFRNVAPSGAAKAIDRRLDGAITEFTSRRMFTGETGSVVTVPVGRHQLPSDMVLFVGLGSFDRFSADVQQLVAENAIRVLVRTQIDEFATVLIGAGSGPSVPAVLKNLLIGFSRGLQDSDPKQRFRGLTLCETDPTRFVEMKEEILRLTRTSLFEDIDLVLNEIEAPSAPELPSARLVHSAAEPVYAIVREEGRSAGMLHYKVSILGSGMKAAVITATQDVDAKKLAAILKRFDHAFAPDSNFDNVASFGKEFADLVLPSEIRMVLQAMQDRHIVVVLDTATSRIPWETLTIDDWSPSVAAGLSRRYLADHLPVATWLEERRSRPTLKLLLVVNPLGDLDGAEREGDRLLQLAGSSTEVTELRGRDASRAAVLAALRTGKFDCVHYAGHAFFDPAGPGRSGLICAGREVLKGSDLVGISNLPFLVFFNACEAGRVRGRATPRPKLASHQVAESAGVAEALMRGGVANYLSTYWPVGDAAAEAFSNTFYHSVLAGKSIGAAALAGRKAVMKLGARDWADYILYGDFDFVLKHPQQ